MPAAFAEVPPGEASHIPSKVDIVVTARRAPPPEAPPLPWEFPFPVRYLQDWGCDRT
jgi:hypothetical protein